MPAPTYDPNRFDSGRYTEDTVAFWAEQFRTLGNVGPADVVVDAGCGTGGFTRHVRRHTVLVAQVI